MSESTSRRDSQAVLLVDAAQEEVMRLRQEIPGLLWYAQDWPFDWDSQLSARSIDAIIIFARKDTERHAIDVCKRISEKMDITSVPLFIAGSRYQMSLAHEVKRLPQADFLFRPIDEYELLDKMKAKQSV